MDIDALDISIELMSWSLAETNRLKARILYKLSRKYEKIWYENND